MRTRPCLPTRIDDRPAAFALSDRVEAEACELAAAQATAHEQRQQDAVAQTFRGRRVGGFEELLGLRQSQPVAGPDARTPGASDAEDGGGGFRGEQLVRGGFRGQLAQRGERQVDRGRRQRALGEVRAVTLHRGPCKALSGGV